MLMYVMYPPPSTTWHSIDVLNNVILILQTEKPKLRQDKYQVQEDPAMKWENGDLNHGLPNSAAHALSNALVLSDLFHV